MNVVSTKGFMYPLCDFKNVSISTSFQELVNAALCSRSNKISNFLSLFHALMKSNIK